MGDCVKNILENYISMNSVGLLIIATNKYFHYAQNLIKSADKHFLKNSNVDYFVFTNSKEKINSIRKVNVIDTEHKPWPWMTLGRYDIFNRNREAFNEMDYLFYCDADMLFVADVEEDILSNRVATQHPGYYGNRGTPETNPKSLACIYDSENMQYFAGGFNGGSKEEYLMMCEKLSFNINKDFENNVIAIWHDESHMNRYFVDNPPTKILNPSYCYAEFMKIPFDKKLLALTKNHEEMRS